MNVVQGVSQADEKTKQYLKAIAPAIPYVAVLIGLYGLHNAWSSIILYHLGMVVILTLTKSWWLGKRLLSWQAYLVLLVVVIGSALSGIIVFYLWSIMKLPELVLGAELTNLGLSQTPWILFMFYYFTINPLLEEIFWRGYLGSPKVAPIWGDFWFAGYHTLVLYLFIGLPWVAASFLVLVAAGWFWRQITRIYGGLMMPILSHAAADAGIIGAIFLLTLQVVQ